jgi:transcriptional regulator with XRE-family HTH domain
MHCDDSIVDRWSGLAQRPKQLAPSLSAAHYFGAQVRRLRERAGWTQAELGIRLIHGQDLVRKVEDGSRIPSPEFVEACERVFATRGALRQLVPLLERERLLRVDRAGGPLTTAGYRSTAPDRQVLDWLVADRPRRPALSEPAGGATLADLRRRDHQRGAGSVYGQVAAIIGQDMPALSVRAPRVAIGFLELAGYDAVDLGADGLAQSHYLRALRIALDSGELLYGGYLIAVSLAHLALHCGDAEQALRLATAGLRGTDQVATHTMRAAFRTVAARARARLGDEAGCTADLRQAEASLALADPADEPGWISYFGAADFADEKAHCFFDLGHHDLVARELDVAVSNLAPTRVRRLAIDTALRASSLARSGKIDEACGVGTVAVDYAAATASFRSVQRVTAMMADLYPYIDDRTVAGLAEHVRAALPLVGKFTRRPAG